MASTYSPDLGLELMATGEDSGTWGTKTNNNLSPLIETAICGVAAVVYASDADKTLVITNGTDSQGRYFVLNCTSGVSLTATRKLICPIVNKTYLVSNATSGGQSIQIIGASGTGITIPNGKSAFVYCDGTNYVQSINWLTGATLAGHTTIEGVTTTGATGTGNLAFSASPTFTGTVTAVTVAASVLEANGSGAGGFVNSIATGSGQINFYSNSSGLANDRSWEHFVGQINGGGYAAIIYGNGDILNQNGSYGTLSDAKLKQDIVPATSQWNDIKAIGSLMKKYHLKTNPTGPLQLGLIAQELQTVSPGLVSAADDFVFAEDPVTGETVRKPTGDQTLQVSQSVLYMKAVKALSEALVRIEALEAKLAG